MFVSEDLQVNAQGHLTIGGQDTVELAKQYGTPLYLLDEDYIRQTRELILSERTRMIKELKSVPTYKVYPAYANFILLKILKPGLTSYDVFEACIRQGLIIRDCSSFQCLDGEFVRFCIMMPEDNSRLVEVLKNL